MSPNDDDDDNDDGDDNYYDDYDDDHKVLLIYLEFEIHLQGHQPWQIVSDLYFKS